ncbi:MAG: long-chain-fatty-acid--CoA ligase [Polyangiales bacterium]
MTLDHQQVFTDPLSPIMFLVRSRRVFPSRPAVIYRDAIWSYDRFGDEVGKMAGALQRAGVKKGVRVAVLAPNTPWHLVAHFSMPLLGAPLVSINTRLSGAEIAHILRHSGATVLLVDPELAPRIDAYRNELPALKRIVELEDGVVPARDGQESYASFCADAPTLPLQNGVTDELDILSINYTSGTTGTPKGVMYTHRGATLNALAQISAARFTKESVFLWTLPMFHCNGWCAPWAVVAASGAHLCMRGVDPAEVIRLIEKHNATHFNGAPTVLRMVCDEPTAKGKHFDPPLNVFTGGAPPSPTLLEACERLGLRVSHLYGLTETYGPHTLCEMQTEWENYGVEARAKIMSRQGVAMRHALYLRVVDDAMNDVPCDGVTMGEVVMRGNNVMRGYYNDPDATAHAFRGGWFHSGDVAVMHADGYIELRDRSKDIVVSGGENISTIEVEHAIVKHPAVQEVAVIGVPHEKWGEVPMAFVQLQPGAVATEDEIIAFVRDQLAHFKCPKSVSFVELPKTSTGKVQKFKLREPYWAGREKRIH